MSLGNSVVLVIIGVFFVILALVFLLKALIHKLRFRNNTFGKILSIETSTHTVRINRQGKERKEQRYTPIVAFTYGGKTFRGKGATVFMSEHYKEGDKIEIFFSPSNPNKFVTTSPRNTLYGGLILLGIGLFFFIIAIILGGGGS